VGYLIVNRFLEFSFACNDRHTFDLGFRATASATAISARLSTSVTTSTNIRHDIGVGCFYCV
jgi:hypothetical protein